MFGGHKTSFCRGYPPGGQYDNAARKHGACGSINAARAGMTNVNSGEQLFDALDRGERDVVVSSHIDLRTLQLEQSQDNILVMGPQTKSLRVCLCALHACDPPSAGQECVGCGQQESFPRLVHCQRQSNERRSSIVFTFSGFLNECDIACVPLWRICGAPHGVCVCRLHAPVGRRTGAE